MGSRISVGVVYNKCVEQEMILELKKLITFLTKHNGHVTKVKMSKDIDGEFWEEHDLPNENQKISFYDSLIMDYYGEIKLTTDLLNKRNLKTTIYVRKNEDYFGFLIQFNEEEIIQKKSLETFDIVTREIINLMYEIYEHTKFDYSFCDHEADIEYSPDIFKVLQKKIYSISILPVKKENSYTFTTIKSNWEIDGLSHRKT